MTTFNVIDGRNVVVRCLTGSHNYNLDGPNSDRDYKYFVMPTFDDLYDGKRYTTSSQSSLVDYTVHDIRMLPEQLWKGNINFMEVLFSIEPVYHYDFQWLFQNNSEFSMMNPRGTISGALGMHNQKMASLLKGTSTTQVLVDTFGYDTKQACHALRCLLFVSRFAETMSFKDAIWFDDTDPQRQILLDVKEGRYTRTEFLELVAHYDNFPSKVNELRAYEGNTERFERLQLYVKGVVRDWLG